MTKKQTETRKAFNWAMKNLAGKKVYHADIGKKIEFTQKGIKHCIYDRTYPLKIEMIYKTIQLLKSARLYRIEKDKNNNPDTLNIFRFATVWKHKGERYLVYLIVKETKNKRMYYDHGVVKKINLD